MAAVADGALSALPRPALVPEEVHLGPVTPLPIIGESPEDGAGAVGRRSGIGPREHAPARPVRLPPLLHQVGELLLGEGHGLVGVTVLNVVILGVDALAVCVQGAPYGGGPVGQGVGETAHGAQQADSAGEGIGSGDRQAHYQGEGQRHHHADGDQSHSPGKGLEPGDGLDACLDVLSSVGHGGGAGEAAPAVIRHGQQDPAVVPAVLPLQPLQHQLVTALLPLVVDAVKDAPQEGVAPVDAPEQGGDPPGGHVPLFQMDQLVKDHLAVRGPAHGEHQHRTDHPHQEGGRGCAALHHPPGHGQTEALRQGGDGLQPGSGHRHGLPQGAAQPQPARRQPQGGQEDPCQIEEEQPVSDRAGQSARRGDGDARQGQGGGPGGGPGGVQPQLDPSPQGLAQPRQVGYGRAAQPAHRQDQPEHHHHPDRVLPLGGELVPEDVLEHEHEEGGHAGRRRLMEEGPEIEHGYTSISSSRRRSSSRSWGERLPSFTKAATSWPAEPS